MALVTLRCCQEDSHPQGRGVERPHPRNPAHRQHHGGIRADDLGRQLVLGGQAEVPEADAREGEVDAVERHREGHYDCKPLEVAQTDECIAVEHLCARLVPCAVGGAERAPLHIESGHEIEESDTMYGDGRCTDSETAVRRDHGDIRVCKVLVSQTRLKELLAVQRDAQSI